MPKVKEITLLPKKKIVPKISVTLLEKALFVVLVSLLVVWAGEIYYKKTIEDNIGDLTTLVEDEVQKRDLSLEEKIYKTGERLESLAKIVPTHTYWTKIFAKLEGLTVPTVWFSDFQAQSLGKISLDGFAANHSALARQFTSFEQDSDIIKVILSEMSRAESGEVGFTFNLTFNPETLIK